MERPGGFDFKIQVIDADHKEDLTKIYPVGFILHLYLGSKREPNITDKQDLQDEEKNPFQVGFTSDTKYHEGLKKFYDCDIVVPHISNAAFRELKSKLGLGKLKPETEDKTKKDETVLAQVEDNRAKEGMEKQEIKKYHQIFDKIESIDRDKIHDKLHDMDSILEWSFWYRDTNWIDSFLDDETICREDIKTAKANDLEKFLRDNSTLPFYFNQYNNHKILGIKEGKNLSKDENENGLALKDLKKTGGMGRKRECRCGERVYQIC